MAENEYVWHDKKSHRAEKLWFWMACLFLWMDQTYEMNVLSVKSWYDSRIQAAEGEFSLKMTGFFLNYLSV